MERMRHAGWAGLVGLVVLAACSAAGEVGAGPPEGPPAQSSFTPAPAQLALEEAWGLHPNGPRVLVFWDALVPGGDALAAAVSSSPFEVRAVYAARHGTHLRRLEQGALWPALDAPELAAAFGVEARPVALVFDSRHHLFGATSDPAELRGWLASEALNRPAYYGR